MNSAITTNNVWSNWNYGYSTTSSCTTYVTSNDIWTGWNQTCGTYGTAGTGGLVTVNNYSTDSIWTAWNENWAPTLARVHDIRHAQPRREDTPEERARREAQEAKWKLEAEERRLEHDAAARRARELLLSLLSEEQKRDWVASAGFFLHVGDKKYRIKKGRSGNVELVDPTTHEPLERYCAHPVDSVPDEDTVVAQMMMLLHAERDFIALANTHRRKPGFRRPDGLQSATDLRPQGGVPMAFDPHHVQQMRRAA